MFETVIAEVARIKENGYTLTEYLRSSRLGMVGALNRSQRTYIFNNQEKAISHLRPENNYAREVSHNGKIAYDAICAFRDEVMYEGA